MEVNYQSLLIFMCAVDVLLQSGILCKYMYNKIEKDYTQALTDLIKKLKLLINLSGIRNYRVLQWENDSLGRLKITVIFSHIFFIDTLSIYPLFKYLLHVSCFWIRQWHPTPVLLPGKSHGWRSLVGCSPWGC